LPSQSPPADIKLTHLFSPAQEEERAAALPHLDDGTHALAHPGASSTTRCRRRLTHWQDAVGDGAGAVESFGGGEQTDAAAVKQAVVRAGFTPLQADDALRAAGNSVQVITCMHASSARLLHYTLNPPPPHHPPYVNFFRSPAFPSCA
jgi:hypothetical protein